MTRNGANPLCLECGLCCNGVIFASVQLEPGDNPAQLKSLGLPLAPVRTAGRAYTLKFPQPCAAFDGCRCRIYSDRPKYCRQFVCRLLQNVEAGKTGTGAARKTIRNAKARVKEVEELLRELGDTGEHVALSARFRRVKKRLESKRPTETEAEIFSRLTLAMHDLNILLAREFYSPPLEVNSSSP